MYVCVYARACVYVHWLMRIREINRLQTNQSKEPYRVEPEGQKRIYRSGVIQL